METTLGRALTVLGREALRIVLPAWCVACGRDLPWRDRVASCCGSCWRSLPRIESAKCRFCALPLGVADAVCIPCSAGTSPLEWCEAWGEYRDALERVLHALKFERHDFLDRPLAALLESTLRARGDMAFDTVVPVPMHTAKRRRRGYNQAELLARALAERIGLRSHTGLLIKNVEKETQSTLVRARRAPNVRGVFTASPRVRGLSLLVVDDICTTGETLRACASELLAHGAGRVCAISVAKAT